MGLIHRGQAESFLPNCDPQKSTNSKREVTRNRRGSQFDPELSDLFLDLVGRLRREHEDLDAFLAKAAVNSPIAQARRRIRSILAEERTNEREIAEALH